MKAVSAFKHLESINFSRFLRRNYIERLVIVLKVCCVVGLILILILSIRDFVQTSLASETVIKKFENSIELAATPAAHAPAVSTARKGEYSLIASKSIFGPINPASAAKSSEPTPKPASTTAMILIGTFISEGQPAFAIIEEQKKKSQDVFNLNDVVFGEAKLVGIFPDHVDLNRNGKIEVLSLDTVSDRPGPAMQGGVAVLDNDEYIVEEAELDKAMENLPMLLTQARAVPFFQNGRAVGLRMFAIKSGSLFEKIGLQNGDVLKAINGTSLADLSQAMQLFQKLKDERTITVVMERNMVEKELKYQIR